MISGTMNCPGSGESVLWRDKKDGKPYAQLHAYCPECQGDVMIDSAGRPDGLYVAVAHPGMLCHSPWIANV